MKRFLNFFVVFALCSTSVLAGEKLQATDCKAVPWPHRRNLSKHQLAKIFHSTPRSQLIGYYFEELSNPKRAKNPALAHALGGFLENTERNELMQGYFQILESSSKPEDGSNVIRTLNLKEICDNFKKTIDAK